MQFSRVTTHSQMLYKNYKSYRLCDADLYIEFKGYECNQRARCSRKKTNDHHIVDPSQLCQCIAIVAVAAAAVVRLFFFLSRRYVVDFTFLFSPLSCGCFSIDVSYSNTFFLSCVFVAFANATVAMVRRYSMIIEIAASCAWLKFCFAQYTTLFHHRNSFASAVADDWHLYQCCCSQLILNVQLKLVLSCRTLQISNTHTTNKNDEKRDEKKKRITKSMQQQQQQKTYSF